MKNKLILYLNLGEKYTNHHHHHIQVEPTNTLKRSTSSMKPQQIVDIQPTIIVQHQRPSSSISRPNSAANILTSSTTTTTTKDPLNEAYIDRDNIRSQVLTVDSNNDNNNNNANDSTSTLKQYENQKERMNNPQNASTPPPSPSNKESNRLWKRQRNKYSTKINAAGLVARKNSKQNRPPARLKNYEEDSDSETTATETQSREDGKSNIIIYLY